MPERRTVYSTTRPWPKLNDATINRCYRKAAVELVDAGEEQHFVESQLTRLKNHLGIVEKQDVVTVPDWLEQRLQTDFLDDTSEGKVLDIVRLDERLVKWIPDFRVEIYTDESKHRGRPHVAVYLKNGKISVSLEDPPINLTPSGGLVGEAKALKVIKKNRKALLQMWDETRVDTQRLT